MKLWLKFVAVAVLALAVLVPLGMIRGTILERERYREQAVSDIAASFAGAQGIAGPVLVVPYVETREVEEKAQDGSVRRVPRERGGQWTFFPARMDVDGRLTPATRHRGLHEVRVYELRGQVAAAFDARIPADDPGLPPRRIGRPWIGYAIADVRGIAGTPRLRIGGREHALAQGATPAGESGVHALLAAPQAGAALRLDAHLELALGGTETLRIAPLAARNRVAIDSPWPHPRFEGDFLPRTREVGREGFRATWEISSLASTAQARWLEGHRLDGGGGTVESAGLSLVDPVDLYALNDRASKYGVLFVLLTFTGFLLFELIRRLRIHPVQYGLVGLALAIFFLLLVGLSEHVAFGWAYLAASVACVGLLGFYVSSVLGGWRRGAGFAAMLGLLYAALYGLLLSEDNALVLGSVLLFAMLAAVMVVTRRLDWYALGAGLAPQLRQPATAAPREQPA